MPRNRTIAALVAALVAAVGGIPVTVALVDNGPGAPPGVHPAVKVTIGARTLVDGPDTDTRPDDALALDPAARAVVEKAKAAPDLYDLGGNLRGPDPTRAGVIRGPLASQEWPGCKTAFVRAFSSRTAPVAAIALHYTAGLNAPGWADVDGLTAFSNNTANQVSWHFAIDREGNCAYNVPITQKAWTISGLNSATVNLEIVGTGHEADYAGPGFARVRAVVRRIGRIEHIPMRLGATDGQCHVTRRGIITHWMGGPCSGGHVDIKPYSIADVVRRIAVLPVTAAERDACAKVAAYRKRHGHTPAGRRQYQRRLALVHARGHHCLRGAAR